MKNVFFVFFYLYLTFIAQLSYAQNQNLALDVCDSTLTTNVTCSASSVAVYAANSFTASFVPPRQAKDNISKLVLTYSLKLYNPADATIPINYSNQNWGVRFVDSNNGSPQDYYLSSAGNEGVTIEVNDKGMRTVNNVYVGTIIVTLYFTDSSINNKLPAKVQNLIDSTNNALGIIPIYSSTVNNSLKFSWQADNGAMLYPPTISVSSADSAIVVNLAAPTNLAAADATSTNLIKTTANTFSGYVLLYWLDRDANEDATGCKANPGGWAFYLNPVSINNAAQNTTSICTYTPYNSSMSWGGTSSALGCTNATAPLTFDSTLSSSFTNLTADTAAVPLTSNPTLFASDSTGTPVGCYYAVYIPSTQSSWSKGNLKNGEIYGVMAWALNNGYDTSINASSPKYSLAHSPIYYVAPVEIPLASTDKTPNLPKTETDCFVVTAASGDVNSKSVFYWRIIRDEYLTPLGITPFYYSQAHTWAAWLNDHPKLKPATNFILEYTGKSIYYTSGFFKKSAEQVKSAYHKLMNLIFPEASAQELTDEKKNTIETFKHPNYDIFITGGVLLPSADKELYDKYYSSQSTMLFELGGEQIFWLDNVGISVGALGRYLTNSSTGNVTTNTGVSQDYTRSIYSLTGEIIVGLRYRHPSFLFIQPGVFGGIGYMRLREEAKTGTTPQSSDGSNLSSGITVWSPIYEVGANLDISLISIFAVNPGDLGLFLNDVLLRSSVSYNLNPSPAISSSGIFIQAGFVFLLK
ncbi:hypothetical protein [Fluviispira sanaruensis]|uniref:Uncharacterized protein n=1 Tax=Fluviispira sanaruensis TaxID=2493639 RepID=A0A4V0P2K3_FLUSA|nr:hypothetical protein [Fluviispira sanaruensis]BBH53527.1 hypothetical protein JCM31447_19710 [Fluviispira sanaruensis]